MDKICLSSKSTTSFTLNSHLLFRPYEYSDSVSNRIIEMRSQQSSGLFLNVDAYEKNPTNLVEKSKELIGKRKTPKGSNVSETNIRRLVINNDGLHYLEPLQMRQLWTIPKGFVQDGNVDYKNNTLLLKVLNSANDHTIIPRQMSFFDKEDLTSVIEQIEAMYPYIALQGIKDFETSKN